MNAFFILTKKELFLIAFKNSLIKNCTLQKIEFPFKFQLLIHSNKVDTITVNILQLNDVVLSFYDKNENIIDETKPQFQKQSLKELLQEIYDFIFT